MALTEGQRSWAAWMLRESERRVAPIGPLSQGYPGLDVADAYEIQRQNITRRIVDGARVIGHKVGLTSAAMQRLLGVDEPDFGQLLDDMLYLDGDTVEAERFCQPRIEPEICFRLAHPLRGPGLDIAAVLDATDAVAPALEIVDSRVRDWQITLPDTIADNASSAALVIGTWTPLLSLPDLDLVRADLVVDGETVATGTGAAVLGHPAAAVAWLGNTLARFGVTLEPGHLVLPGAFTTAPYVYAGQKVEARFSALDPVSVTFV